MPQPKGKDWLNGYKNKIPTINEYSKVAGYKIKTQKSKSLAFRYTNNEKVEKEIKETVPFTIVTKRILWNIST